MPKIRRMPLELFPPFSSDVPALMDESDSAMETYKDALLGLNWDALHNQSAVLAGMADKILRDTQARSDLEELWAESLSERDSEMRSTFSALAADNSPEATQAKANLLAEMTQQVNGDAVAAQASYDALLDGSSPVLHSRKTKKSIVAGDQELLVSSYAQLSAAATTATVEAAIRLTYEKTEQITPTPMDTGDISLLNNEINTLQNLHDEVLQKLYTLLKDEAASDRYLEACTAEQAHIAMRIPTSAMIAGAYLALIQQTTSASDKTAQYLQALTLIELLARLQVLHAYTGMVRAGMATVDPGRWYSHEKNRVDNRQMATKQPKGTPHAIPGLHNLGLQDGEFISLSGVVQNLRIEDDPSPPKFSTFFDLLDLETGESVQVRAHMFSLINNGLTNGAYTRLHGFLRKNEPWLTDAGLEIDRVSLSTLRQESWHDDITYRVRNFYRLYIDEMNMFNTPFIA